VTEKSLIKLEKISPGVYPEVLEGVEMTYRELLVQGIRKTPFSSRTGTFLYAQVSAWVIDSRHEAQGARHKESHLEHGAGPYFAL
jgi:hypothetical protein